MLIITDIVSELSTMMANVYVDNLKEKDPKKLDEITELFCNLTDVATLILKESPEFRQKFAQVHAEFLKHPESEQIIQGSINAFNQYKSKVNLV